MLQYATLSIIGSGNNDAEPLSIQLQDQLQRSREVPIIRLGSLAYPDAAVESCRCFLSTHFQHLNNHMTSIMEWRRHQ